MKKFPGISVCLLPAVALSIIPALAVGNPQQVKFTIRSDNARMVVGFSATSTDSDVRRFLTDHGDVANKSQAVLINLSGSVSAAGLANLADSLSRVRGLSFQSMTVSEDMLLSARRIPGLTSLAVLASEISPAAARQFSEWDTLHELKLQLCPQAEQIVRSAAGSRLRKLSLSRIPLSQGLLLAVSRIATLESLDIYAGNDCDRSGFAELARLPHLKEFSVQSTDLVTAGIGAISKFAMLETIHLHDVGPLNDSHLESIVTLSHLTDLRIDSLRISNRGLKLLKRLSSLKFLSLPSILIETDTITELLERNVQLYGFPGAVRIWQTSTGKQIYSGRMHGDIQFTSAAQYLSVCQGPVLSLFDMTTGSHFKTANGIPAVRHWYSLAADTGRLGVRRGQTIIIQSLVNNDSDIRAEISADAAGDFAFIPRRNTVAFCQNDAIRIVNADDGTPFRRLVSSTFFRPARIAVGASGRHIAAFGQGGVRTWNLSSGIELMPAPAATDVVGFVHDERTLLVTDQQQLIELNLATGESRAVLKFVSENGPATTAVCDSANIFAYASGDTIFVYDVRSWKQLNKFRYPSRPGQPQFVISSITLSPDGKLLAAAAGRKVFAGN